MSTDLIRTVRLSKNYRIGTRTIPALHRVSLTIGRGEFVAIMGPSGSGKSTLLTLLGCLTRPSGGRYWFDGRAVEKLNATQLAQLRNRRIGFVFQSFLLLPRLNAWENVALPLQYAGVPRRERKTRALEALASVGLANRSGHRPEELSGGQQQRVAIARALINSPDVLLADEPTGALDSRTGSEIMTLFRTLNQTGITVVLVTHDPHVADHADRILHFRDGRLIREQSPIGDSCDVHRRSP